MQQNDEEVAPLPSKAMKNHQPPSSPATSIPVSDNHEPQQHVGERSIDVRALPCSSSNIHGALGGEAKAKGELGRVSEAQNGVLVVVVDVGVDEKKEVEAVCRICHIGSELGGSELLHIGCACKGELGCAHRHCAEAWFRVKGNRFCEICGGNAANVSGEGHLSFMESWRDMRMLRRNNQNSAEQRSCWSGQPFCNFLMACLVIAFIIPWFFRVNLFN